MQYDVQQEMAAGDPALTKAKQAFSDAGSLECLVEVWLREPEQKIRLTGALDKNGRPNGCVAVVLEVKGKDCAWIEIPIADLKLSYPEIVSVRDLLRGCRRADNWQSEAEEKESFEAREKAMEPLDELFPAKYDEDFCMGQLARKHVIPFALCYAISGCAERNKARAEYEQAKAEHKAASLLEQQRPNVFQMNVANILPGETIEVQLAYTELLVPEDKMYELVVPAVVGPRYSNTPSMEASTQDKWVSNPYLPEGTPSTYAYDITARIAAGMPVQKIASSSHQIDVNYQSADVASVALSAGENGSAGDRDFILRYQLAGDSINTGVLLYQGADENFFMLMAQPPARIENTSILPREYIFIVDVSGSMSGFPLSVSKSLIRELLSKLNAGDRFNVLVFASGFATFAADSVPATDFNISSAFRFVDAQGGSGGTELLPAIKTALSLPKPEGFSRSIVLATDGFVDVEEKAFSLVRENLNQSNFFAFGIGSSVNRYLIEGLASAGMGESFVVERMEQASGVAARFIRYVKSPVLSSIKVSFDGFDAYDIEPAVQPDLLAERPLLVMGKWRGTASGKIEVSGISGEGAFKQAINVSGLEASKSNSALRYLWARKRIKDLSDFSTLTSGNSGHSRSGKALRAEEAVTELGLKYNLLTKYTSFLAIDSEVRANAGPLNSVTQPLPLPRGVSNYAVGGMAPGLVSIDASQIAYNDGRIADAVSTIFGHIEGASGAIIMLAFGALSLACATLRRYKTACVFLILTSLVFISRCVVAQFFNCE